MELRTVVAASPEAVWAAFTDPEHLVRWFPLQASVVPGAGGNLRLTWGDIGSAWSISEWHPYEALEARQLAAFASKSNESGFDVATNASHGWRVRIQPISRLETLVDLEHFGLDESSLFRASVRRGWEFELFGLRYYLERQFEKDRSISWARETVACEPGYEFEIWESLVLNRSCVPAWFRFQSADISESPWQFVGTLANPESSVFRVKLDRIDRRTVEVNLWLSAYDSAPERAADVQREFERCLVEMVGARPKDSAFVAGRAG